MADFHEIQTALISSSELSQVLSPADLVNNVEDVAVTFGH